MSTDAALQYRAAPGIPANIEVLTGPMVIGWFINWGLLGALTVQAYMYYVTFPNDRKLPRYLAASVYVLEVLQTILMVRDAFRMFGPGFGDMAVLNTVGWVWFSGPVLGGVVGAIAQVFYAWRIWVFSASIWLPVLIVLLAMLQSGAAMYVGSNSHKVGQFNKLLAINHRNTPIWLVGTAACDLLIAGAMTYYLLTAHTGIRATKKRLVKLVRLSLETGSISAACAILEISLFLRYENNFHLTPSFAISKLYSNSLFAVLNARSSYKIDTHITIDNMGWEDTTLSMQGTESTKVPDPLNLARERATATRTNDFGVSVDAHVVARVGNSDHRTASKARTLTLDDV